MKAKSNWLLWSAVVLMMTITVEGGSYFPIASKDGDEGISETEAKWYSQSLERMKEPQLNTLTNDAKVQVYRFTVLPTWGNPIAIRIQRNGERLFLSARRLDGEGGYDPGKLVEIKDRQLSKSESQEFQRLLRAMNFIEMPTNEEPNVFGNDGEMWILEGATDGKYHFIHRWCAGTYKTKARGLEQFMALCKWLVDRSNLTERPKNLGNELL